MYTGDNSEDHCARLVGFRGDEQICSLKIWDICQKGPMNVWRESAHHVDYA